MDSNSRFPNPGTGMSVASLLSPPEVKKADSFSSPFEPVSIRTPSSSFSSEKGIVSSFNQMPAPRPYASPPISPYTNPQKENMAVVEEGGAVQDPPLFGPGDNSEVLPSNVPLFENRCGSTDLYVDSVISSHIAKTDSRFSSVVQRPSREDYALALSLTSVVATNYNHNPRAWIRQERDFLARYGAQNKVVKRKILKKLAPATSTTPSKKIVAAMPRTARAQRPVAKRTPQNRVLDSFDLPYGSPSQKLPTKAASNRDDVDFASLPDYAPPLATLPKNSSKTLKAEWKPPALDLSDDPNKALLDDSEKTLASTLRLTAAHYLTAKRRIFMARIDALRIGKEFRKTDAQQACKIDVNKASKLWTAFDKVGWFNPDYFRQYI